MNFDGMWAEPDSDPREALEPGRGEKAVLAEYLDRYRMTFELKCEGLTAEQLAIRSVPPSTMSLLGMIRHLARVEHSWTRRVFEGQIELPRLYRTEEDPDLDFNQAVADDLGAQATRGIGFPLVTAMCVRCSVGHPQQRLDRPAAEGDARRR